MEAADVGPLLPGAQDGDETLPVGLPACDICDKTFKTDSEVRKHRRCHFEGKYQCHICGKKYKTPGNRNVHLRQVHGNAKFDCQFCDKSYQSQAALKKHVKKKHAGEEDLQERQLEEDPDLTLEAPETGGEEMDVHLGPEEIQEMTLHVVHGDSSQMNDCSVILSTECAVQEVEEQEEVLILPDMETETQDGTTISEETEDFNTDFNTVYRSCFHENSHSSDNNNGASGEHNCSIKVKIGDGDKFLTISGEEELAEVAVTASVVLHEYFYGTLPPEEREESNDTAAALPGPALTLASPEAEEEDTENKPSLVSDVGSDYAEYTGAEETQEADMPALASDMGMTSKRYSPPQQMGGDKCPCHGKVNECESDFPITTAQRTPPGGEASKTLCRHLSNAPYAVPGFTPSLPRGHIMAVPVTDPRLDQHTKMVRGQVEQRDTRKTSIRD